MLVRAPLVEAEQHSSVRIQDLTEIVMAGRRLGLAEQRLIPFETAWNVAYADDCPCAFHSISAGLSADILIAICGEITILGCANALSRDLLPWGFHDRIESRLECI